MLGNLTWFFYANIETWVKLSEDLQFFNSCVFLSLESPYEVWGKHFDYTYAFHSALEVSYGVLLFTNALWDLSQVPWWIVLA